ncbi:MAG TPA: phosphoribosylformylglycinamidine synthase subunit PurL, partial [Nitrospiria bacterium]|nr:phosphoribosylformylglycinamidine synthase subunit PurL [Nitrospiria bacterium]
MEKAKQKMSAATELNLSEEEYQKIVALLGREPNWTELGIFSVMWSEHCSYKSSRVHLKKFPTQGERVLQGPGENAGAVDIGGGWAAVFKIESHNHPSYIEPYQGAATGVGGILRDIFTMGARPVALLDSLRFGPLENPKNRYLFEHVVAGIAGYGNCVGVPTVGGEVCFNEIYTNNPLVNVFCLGIVRADRILRASASGVGNPVIYVGSKTGRDGIHGATMASAEFNDKSAERRPAVQVGDPFTEKLLLEACLELFKTDAIVAIQDMGAAGLTSSSVEMASRGGVGIEIDVSKIPLREPGMTPYEIMLSESQERMLIVARRGREEEVVGIFQKWDLEAAEIGRVVDGGYLTVKRGDEIAARLPITALTEEAPVYEREMSPPKFHELIQSLSLESIHEPKDYNKVLQQLLGSQNLASKEWVYRQYDYMVRTDTVTGPGGDAAVLRVKEADVALALSVDGNSTYTLLNPYQGGAIAAAEAARNVVCAGGKPIGLTDCLNFGSPERKDVMWQFALAIEGISDVCRRLSIPVVSGNVSFYNETKGLSVYPTPIVGVVGVIEPANRFLTPWFKSPGDSVVLLGATREELGGTAYLKEIFGQERGFPPMLHLEEEANLQGMILDAAGQGFLSSAHDCSEGGLAVALAECCLGAPTHFGAAIEMADPDFRTDALLFGETQSRVVVSVPPEKLRSLLDLAAARQVPCQVVGEVKGDRLIF